MFDTALAERHLQGVQVSSSRWLNLSGPVDVRPERSTALGMRWLVIYARERGEKTMVEAGGDLWTPPTIAATWTEREDTHKMAEANKAFAHYRW